MRGSHRNPAGRWVVHRDVAVHRDMGTTGGHWLRAALCICLRSVSLSSRHRAGSTLPLIPIICTGLDASYR